MKPGTRAITPRFSQSPTIFPILDLLLKHNVSYFLFPFPDVSTVGEIKDSTIVGNNEAHLTKLSEWLKPVVKSGHQWKLCWRASRDGWASSTFHSKCDNRGPTVTIVKTGNYIFGGYTSISWSKWWISFIFSVNNSKPSVTENLVQHASLLKSPIWSIWRLLETS